ncbi:MAG: PSP1 C-terminal domain-containing protein [Planctomycetota bacterium]|nr:PSP1 C-terminal domain-containing protein [Planctomycetota bacterium]
MGTVLEAVRAAGGPTNGHADNEPVEESGGQRVLRIAASEELTAAETSRADAQASFESWRQRMVDWKLQLDLLDLEWTLDRQKLLLYVLGGRGPETTRLALLAAAAGLAKIEVQPVGADGLQPVEKPAGGGCGSGGGGCGCSH